ncbi:MAG: hypothetical protein J0M15_06525 [Deltaproteobacteria bacterium]|jgi:HPt (histidine-containing phosphotransfer) domain-containing protein|nr:hypothetical protein [Deltaproteobacteria bacterium]
MKTEIDIELEMKKHSSFFLDSRKNDVDLIKKHSSEHDYKSIQKICHNIKGFSKPFGFPTLAELAIKLDAECSVKNDEKINQITNEMMDYICFYRS